jgi:hypothetical protein
MLTCRYVFPVLLHAILATQGMRADDVRKPVTTRTDEAGLLINRWLSEGTAAGNDGDFYDNRDGGHSLLDLSKYLQLTPLSWSLQQIEEKKNFGMPTGIRPETILGNASLSGTARNGASIPRIFYSSREGLTFLTAQYLGNQIYVYPEHQDHDPAAVDGSGWGDLYPTNSPYLIISQGSSYTDQPFLHAIAMTLASFRPDIKRDLQRRHLLMPVVQTLLRQSLKRVQSPEDYLTGIAHPSVFRGEEIDELKMMKLAQSMTRETLPPVFHLEVIGETPPPKPGIDFFESAGHDSEALADQGMVVARVFRGMAREREIRVRIADSQDFMARPLTYEWRVLRGDPDLVKIEPNALLRDARITVTYQDGARPVPGTPEITSRRIDIGVFANNGVSYSPPCFITFSFLPNEHRRYNAETGRILETDYSPENSFVDITLTSAKPWKDRYRYDETSGALLGWTRERQGKPPVDFDAEGKRLEPSGPVEVRYETDPATHLLEEKIVE